MTSSKPTDEEEKGVPGAVLLAMVWTKSTYPPWRGEIRKEKSTQTQSIDDSRGDAGSYGRCGGGDRARPMWESVGNP
eukprot:5979112-Pyramimonas_sp.AAC.1